MIRNVQVGIIAFFAGIVLSSFGWLEFHKNHPITLKEIVPAKTVWLHDPDKLSPAELKDCVSSPINIQCTGSNGMVVVNAFDDCKTARATWQILTPQPLNMITAGIGVAYMDRITLYGEIGCLRRFGTLYIGGSIQYGIKYTGVTANAVYTF